MPVPQTDIGSQPVGYLLWRALIRGLTVSRMSETHTPPGSSEPEPPAAPQYDAPAPPPPPPAGGYTAPVAGQVAPVGYANQDEKTWALVAHFGAIVVSFIAPLIVFLTKGNESATVRAHSVQALNFQITWAIATVAAVILGIVTCGVLGFLPFITWLVSAVFAVIGGIKANDGVLYKYPVSYEFIK
jgi:uncharacterized Tic20 family protein